MLTYIYEYKRYWIYFTLHICERNPSKTQLDELKVSEDLDGKNVPDVPQGTVNEEVVVNGSEEL
jgi:hypothetical protein